MLVGALNEEDLPAFNRWLCTTRLRAVVGLAIFLGLSQLVAPGVVAPRPVLVLLFAMAVANVVGVRLRWPAGHPRLFFQLQNVIDVSAIAVGVGVAASGGEALLLRALFVLPIVPSTLVSTATGLQIVALASVYHVVLLVVDGGPAALRSVGAVAPPCVFLLVAQQCFFYGRHLRDKNRALRALVSVAQTVGATLEAPELLSRVTATLQRVLEADWVGTFLVDRGRAAFRLVASTGANVDVAGLARVEFPLVGWPAVRQLAAQRLVSLDGPAAAQVPAPFAGGSPFRRAVLANLRRDDVPVGFVAVGWRRRAGRAGATTRLLADVADHVAIALRNAQLLEEVRLASALKSEFVGAVSHELRSPLNVILGYTEMLREGAVGPVTPEQTGALDRTHRQAMALLEMITSLLDLNRLEAGRLPVEVVPVAPERLVREVIEQVPDDWRREGVALHEEIEPGLPLLATDPGKLKTALRNLLHNALKFTAEGRVTVAAQRTADGGVALSVRDTGRGIPLEALPYVFDMFRQVPGSGGGGVGLGLHIVRRFVEALGGAVDVRSTPGVGTCFTITLPPAERPLVAEVA